MRRRRLAACAAATFLALAPTVARSATAENPPALPGVFLGRFDPKLSEELAGLRAALLDCTWMATSVGHLMAISARCADAERIAARVRERVHVLRWSTPVNLDEQRALELVDEAALSTGLYAAAEHRRLESELPDIPFGRSNFALTLQVFGGLFRLQSPSVGPTFSALTGIGGGLKLRYDYVHANTRREAVGLNLGLFVEKGASDQYTLSTVVLISTFSYFYGGLGIRLVGTEHIGDTAAARLFFVLGIGVDGKSLN
jgi:hypothetical protein